MNQINNIDKSVSLHPTRHCMYTSNKKITLQARINSTFTAIRARMFIVLSVLEVTKYIQHVFNKYWCHSPSTDVFHKTRELGQRVHFHPPQHVLHQLVDPPEQFIHFAVFVHVPWFFKNVEMPLASFGQFHFHDARHFFTPFVQTTAEILDRLVVHAAEFIDLWRGAEIHREVLVR